jgi:hypothetical protein
VKRYYFDLSGGGWEPDRIGTELADDSAAKEEAIRFAGEVLRDEPHRLAQGPMRVDVHDRGLSFRFTIEVRLVRS